ncbi:MAG TPA: chorismate mutase, partial [Casimicrobiaceae bacterium]|nr:chorismate mutase [Casimicrobiaceae bacterium]
MAASGEQRDGDLAHHRAAIDALDGEILARLNERATHAKAIGALKATAGGAAYRPEREAQVLARVADENPGPLPDEAVAGIFREIMSACLALEQRLRVAYLGPAGTFTH